MRFKDRQPSSVAHLDLLLAETFQELLQLGDAVLSNSASRDSHKLIMLPLVLTSSSGYCAAV